MAALAVPLLGGAAAIASGSDGPRASEQKEDRASDAGEDRGTRVRLGGITVGAGYSHFSGYPYFGSPFPAWPYYWSRYDLLFYPSYGWLGGFVHPGYYRNYREGPGMGQVKLRSDEKLAPVYLDGGYAGVAKDLKTIWLTPGAYDLEVRTDNESFSRRIYVLSGKTVRIDAKLSPVQEKRP
jgi:hypothetical protein